MSFVLTSLDVARTSATDHSFPSPALFCAAVSIFLQLYLYPAVLISRSLFQIGPPLPVTSTGVLVYSIAVIGCVQRHHQLCKMRHRNPREGAQKIRTLGEGQKLKCIDVYV